MERLCNFPKWDLFKELVSKQKVIVLFSEKKSVQCSLFNGIKSFK